MVSNLKVLKDLIFGRVEPHIYAFKTNTIPNYLKVGDTYRPVSERLKEWRNFYPNLNQEFENTATVSKDTYFRDYSVHKYLENNLNKKRLTPKDIGKGIYFSNEFFKNTTSKDVKESINDIKKDYETKGNKYSFYNALTSLPQNIRYSPTGIWKPRDNQQQAIDAFKQAIKNGRTNLLMYAVMRFGKSFTAMCCANEIKAKFVVVVSAKADVQEEWKKTVESAENFKDYEFLTKEDLKINYSIIKKCLLNNKKIVLFLTLQDLQGEDIKEKHQQVFAQQIDLLIVDETHFGARAEKYGEILRKKYEDEFVKIEDAKEEIKVLKAKIQLHLSGTPYRILMGSEFEKEDIIAFVQYSDIVDEQKKWDEEHLFNNDKTKWEEWDNPYYGFPQMVRFAFNLNKSSMEKIEELKKSGVSSAFSELFKTKSIKKTDDNSHKIFVHNKEILELFEAIDGSKEDKNLFSFLDYDKIKEGDMCRHIVCVLPYCSSCDALEKLIKDNKTKFKNLCEYEIINISGIDNKYENIKNIKETISDCEKRDKKTITLTVNRMLTGSTVEQWDTMLYLKDTSSPQDYDQAIFRLQNPYIKTYITENDKENNKKIKYNMKPQTLLVDFSPDRMFKMQESKSQIYNVNIDESGNKKLGERIKKELEISPIITINKDKIKQVEESDIMAAVSNYSKNRGVAEETNDIPVDLNLMEISEIRDRISKEYELGSKLGFKIKANEGEGEDIEIPDSANEPNKGKQQTESKKPEEDKKLNPEKQFRMYYARILYFAFLTKDNVESIDDILNCIHDTNNYRIFKNLQLDENVIISIKNNMDKFKLRKLDYAVQNINKLSNETSLKPIDRAIVANKKFGKIGESEVVTPANITTDMINLLPDKFFKECVENKKCILDIASKEGEFAIAIYKKFDRLGYGANKIKNLIYSIPTSSITYEFTRKIYEILDLNIENIAYTFNSYDLLKIKDDKNNIDYDKIKLILTQNKKFSEITIEDNPKVGGNNTMIFNAVVGNPPYQINDGGHGSSSIAIYDNFVLISEKLTNNYVSLIIPARWMTGGKGKGIKNFRQKMLNDKHIRLLYIFLNPDDCFSSVQVEGGICYFLRDNKKESKCKIISHLSNNEIKISNRYLNEGNVDIFVKDDVALEILKKVQLKTNDYFSSMVFPRNPFKITEKDLNKLNDNKISKYVIFGRFNNQRMVKGINFIPNYSNDIDKQELLDNYKVFISKADGAAGQLGNPIPAKIIGKPELGYPNMLCTETFLAIGIFKYEYIAKNVIKYMKSKFFRMMVSIRKNKNMTQDTYKFVPLQDFTNKSYINWNCSIEEIDKQLYKKYNLTSEEIKFIEAMIKPME